MLGTRTLTWSACATSGILGASLDYHVLLLENDRF
jgi:hypothetical protein